MINHDSLIRVFEMYMFTIEFLQKKTIYVYQIPILVFQVCNSPNIYNSYANITIDIFEYQNWKGKRCFLYSVFLFHSHSKVNCGKKQIIIPVSTNSTPKYPFLTPYLPTCTQLKIENIVSFFIYTICFAITSSKIFPGVL